MFQMECDLVLGVDNGTVDVVMEDLGHLEGITADHVTDLGNGAGEVVDSLGGDIFHVRGINSEGLGSPLHLVSLNLQGLDVEGDLNEVVALGHLA